jgi:hypothetical protein
MIVKLPTTLFNQPFRNGEPHPTRPVFFCQAVPRFSERFQAFLRKIFDSRAGSAVLSADCADYADFFVAGCAGLRGVCA